MHEQSPRACRTCGTEKPASEFYFRKETGRYKTECKACVIERARMRQTGWSPEAYEKAFILQNGTCAICKTALNSSRYSRLAADHCHKTKKLRGLLCTSCNTALGLLKDSPERIKAALEYVQRHASD
jgi:hypothetical protein